MKTDLSLPDKCPICNGTIISKAQKSHCLNEFEVDRQAYYHFWQERHNWFPRHFGLRIPECVLLMAIFIHNKWFIFNEKDFNIIYNSRDHSPDHSSLSKIAIKEFDACSFEEAYIILKKCSILYNI